MRSQEKIMINKDTKLSYEDKKALYNLYVKYLTKVELKKEHEILSRLEDKLVQYIENEVLDTINDKKLIQYWKKDSCKELFYNERRYCLNCGCFLDELKSDYLSYLPEWAKNSMSRPELDIRFEDSIRFNYIYTEFLPDVSFFNSPNAVSYLHVDSLIKGSKNFDSFLLLLKKYAYTKFYIILHKMRYGLGDTYIKSQFTFLKDVKIISDLEWFPEIYGIFLLNIEKLYHHYDIVKKENQQLIKETKELLIKWQ